MWLASPSWELTMLRSTSCSFSTLSSSEKSPLHQESASLMTPLLTCDFPDRGPRTWHCLCIGGTLSQAASVPCPISANIVLRLRDELDRAALESTTSQGVHTLLPGGIVQPWQYGPRTLWFNREIHLKDILGRILNPGDKEGWRIIRESFRWHFTQSHCNSKMQSFDCCYCYCSVLVFVETGYMWPRLGAWYVVKEGLELLILLFQPPGAGITDMCYQT